MKYFKIYTYSLLIILQFSCSKFLEVVPDNVATIENAFTTRAAAEKYLFTCYSYMPSQGNIVSNPAFLSGDEMMVPEMVSVYRGISLGIQIERGYQNVASPYINYWDGEQGGKPLFQGIRNCNIFLDNIAKVPDILEMDRKRWTAEVYFLKAYYQYWLLRMYGPIPLIKENLPISSSIEEVKLKRAPVDECVNYIVQLLDEAAVDLPETVLNKTAELGRITKPIALAVKAKVLITAASPLFNGNSDYASFKNNDGQLLFNSVYDATKWEKAAVACKEAIDLCHLLGNKLNYYKPAMSQYSLSPEILTQMGIRNSLTEKWNPEIIWANTNSMAGTLQIFSQAKIDPTQQSNQGFTGCLAPSMKMAELFYTENGVPIEEDNTWDYNGRLDLKTATATDKFRIKQGYTTASLHFNREPRFYADLGFDGGIWYGQGKFDDQNTFWLEVKAGQSGASAGGWYSGTGYYIKKYVNFNNVISTGNTYSMEDYPWPVIRLADLYLLYAEALNEQNGPAPEVFEYINLVRLRAGLKTVEESWTSYSKLGSSKYATKVGLRDIIHQERLIELAFEGQRFWDLKRWKDAPRVMNSNINGWDISQETALSYYRITKIFKQTFLLKDYFWPIKEIDLIINRNLVQNPGW